MLDLDTLLTLRQRSWASDHGRFVSGRMIQLPLVPCYGRVISIHPSGPTPRRLAHALLIVVHEASPELC